MSETIDNDLALLPRSALPTILANDPSDILGKLASRVAAHKPDVSTKRGRDDIRTLAADIASGKMDLIRLGKKLTEDWRKSTKAVNEECNTIEERMNALRDQVRAPLTEFENREKERVAEHERELAAITEAPGYGEREAAEELSRRLLWLCNYPPRDWQEFKQRADDALAAEIKRTEGLLARAEKREAEAAELTRLRAEEEERQRAEAERQRIEREARIAADAAERARVEAEQRAAAEAAAAARREQEAREQIERERAEAEARAIKAEADRIAAEQRAERERVAAEERAATAAKEAAKAAERRRLQAIEDERRRVAEEKAAEEAERQKREANVAHRKKINREALAALLTCGLTEEQGMAVVTAIAKGAVPHVSIGY